MNLFYVPCPDKELALKIARQLLEEKLVACANLLPQMESIYWWQGKIESSSECILLLKTIITEDGKDKLQKRISDLHPYDTPCIMEIPVQSINASYKKWLEESLL